MNVKSILGVCGGAIAVGVLLGVVLGYVEARPWTWRPEEFQPVAPAPIDEAQSVKPLLNIDEPVYNFDAMEVGTSQRHTFRLENESNEPLSVTYVSMTCQCTGLMLDGQAVEPGAERTIAPGKTLEATLEWEAKPPPRPFRHGATLTSTDPANSRIELLVEGEVVASSTLEPQRLLFGSVPVKESATAQVQVFSRVASSVEVLSWEVEGPELAEAVEVDVQPLDAHLLAERDVKSGVRLVATLAPQKTLGPLNGRLRVRTNLENAAELSIPISANVTGDIAIYGPGWLPRTGLLRLGSIHSDEGKEVRLSVAVRGDHAMETNIDVASIDPSELQVTVGERRRLNDKLVHIPLVITAPKGIPTMVRRSAPTDGGADVDSEVYSRGEGELVLSTTHPETPEVRLRISLTVVP